MKKNLLAISLLTMSCLYGILAGVLILVFVLLDLPISIGILTSIVVIIIQFLIAPALNDFVFRVFYKCKFDYEIPDYLKEFITLSCQSHNMKYPKIGFIDDGSPNAFTYGRTKNDARVVITRGILELLTEDEVKAVVAHELGHANHYDMLFMTVAQVVPLVLYYVADLLMNVSGSGSSKSSGNGKSDYGALIGLIAYVLYFVSQFIILSLSRTREYYADSFAIEETKSPSSLAKALVKIGFGLAIGSKKEGEGKVNKGNALGINDAKVSKGIAISSFNNGGVSKEAVINAMKWERWNPWAKIIEIESTHPLISNRLLAISSRCPEFGEEPYIEFNEQKTESYFGRFLFEIFISILPLIIFFIGLICSFIFSVNKKILLLNSHIALLVAGIFGILFVVSLFIKLNITHKNKNYTETTIKDLLGEVKVSNVTSVPCIIEGKIIGRGNPGCIFNEDFVIQDETGIIFLDYNQPLNIINKLFALFKSKEYFEKTVKVKGWYRRSTAPYIEVKQFEVDGTVKKCHTYTAVKVFYWILAALSVWAIISSLI